MSWNICLIVCLCFIFYVHQEELFPWHIEERFIHTNGYSLCDLNFN